MLACLLYAGGRSLVEPALYRQAYARGRVRNETDAAANKAMRML